MRTELSVRLGDRSIGALRDDDGRMAFTYDVSWLASERAFAISLSLPLCAETYDGGPAHAFFANLLPEGDARQAVCRRLGISVDNDVALLRAIGGECAGALTIVEPGTPASPEDPSYEEMGDARLQALVGGGRVVPLLVGGATTRLSLAGAQAKLPVALLDGRIKLPLAGAPSTHILKLPNPRFAHITANEAFVLGLARHIGLDAVAAELVTRTKPPSLLVERYDRRRSEDPWPATRLHQEDLCQALGVPGAKKYEQEGGPSLSAAVELVRSSVRRPLVDVQRLIAWQAFNVAVGNADGHGKNLSILHDSDGPRLAPFYDLLSTRHYAMLDRHLAMGIGGSRDPDTLARGRWEALAKELGVGERVLVETVRGVADRCIDRTSSWTREFRDRWGKGPVLETLPRAIVKRARRLARSVD